MFKPLPASLISILSYLFYKTVRCYLHAVNDVATVMSGRFVYTTLRSNQIILYKAIKNTEILPPRWISGYEVLSPMSFHEAFTHIVNEMKTKMMVNFGIMELIVELADLDTHGTDPELAKMSNTFRTVNIAWFNSNNYVAGFTWDGDILNRRAHVDNKLIIFRTSNFLSLKVTRYLLGSTFSNDKERKALIADGYMDSFMYMEQLGFFFNTAQYESYKKSRETLLLPISVINYPMKASGGLGLMVADESTRATPKKARYEAPADAAAAAAEGPECEVEEEN